MYGGTIPVAVAPRSYSDRVMLVGDAAGQVKPFSGGGIYTGLVAAKYCAQTAIKCLLSGIFKSEYMSNYEKNWRSHIGSELLRSSLIRRFGLSLTDDEMSKIISVLQKPNIQNIVVETADIDYPSKAILRLAKEVPEILPLIGVGARHPLAMLSLLRAYFIKA
mgnify:CR=1 FL=1